MLFGQCPNGGGDKLKGASLNQSANLSDGVLGSFTNRFSHQHEQNPYLPDPRDTSRAP